MLKRREFLKVATALATASPRMGGLRAQSGLPSPARFVSQSGFLDAVLEPSIFMRQFGGKEYKLVGYNGMHPGPILEGRPGDTVRVTLKNNLDHATNLHFHGLHVTPQGNGDNSFLRVDAGETFSYMFKIPDRHPAGLYWYHPHMHGLSNLQVRSGMAGIINVRDDFDQIGDIPGAVVQDVVYQTLEYFVYNPPHLLGVPHPHHPPPDNPPPLVSIVNGDVPELDASGNVRETVKVQRGGLVRLRIANLASNRHIRLAVVSPRGVFHDTYLIATDGAALPQPVPIDDLLLVGGQRAELLVETDPVGSPDDLLAAGYNNGGGKFSLVELPHYNGFNLNATRTSALVTFEYSGVAPRELRIPQRLQEVESLPLPGLPMRRFVFKIDESVTPPKFTINGLEFDPDRVDVQAKLGTVEDWELVNDSPEDHTFHIHTNQFQVLDVAGNPESAWRDSIRLPRHRRARVRVRFADFPGKTMYHCHMLAHEDNSMMQVLEIVE